MPRVEAAAISHVGRVRTGNEDNFLILGVSGEISQTSSQKPDEVILKSQSLEIDQEGAVFAVSDGMGGALAGEVASKMAVDTVSVALLDADPERTVSPDSFGDSLVGRLYDATVYSNHLIHKKGREPKFSNMGATFTAVAITNEEIDLVQVGDSRVYLIRDGKIHQITKDQSLVQQLIDTGQISEHEAETHPLKNVILQALGAQTEIYPVAARLMPMRNDLLLICSDGLSNKIDGADLRDLVLENQNDLTNACNVLVDEANNRGGEDNITLILARISGDDLPVSGDSDVELKILSPESIHDTEDQDTSKIL